MPPFPSALAAFACPRWPTAFGFLLGTVMVSGCMSGRTPVAPTPVAPLERPEEADGDGCGAKALADLQGQHFSRLADVPIRGALRILHPHQAMTMDFSPARLNVRVNRSGNIIEVFCG